MLRRHRQRAIAYDTYTPWTGYLLQVLAAITIGIFVKLTTGRGPLEAFVTMTANRSKRAITDRNKAPTDPHHT
jgi:hypothetical protein